MLKWAYSSGNIRSILVEEKKKKQPGSDSSISQYIGKKGICLTSDFYLGWKRHRGNSSPNKRKAQSISPPKLELEQP
jgi:hypothetical protein